MAESATNPEWKALIPAPLPVEIVPFGARALLPFLESLYDLATSGLSAGGSPPWPPWCRYIETGSPAAFIAS